MNWNPFAKLRATPLCDALSKVTTDKIANELAMPPEDHAVLARIIAYRSMRTASGYLEMFPKSGVKVPNLDVVAFETLAFNAYAIRHAYNPIPRLGAEDHDEVQEKYEQLFDEDVSEAFKLAAGICASLAERATGWDDLIEITNRRQMHYAMAKSDDDMHSRFLGYVRNCQTSARAKITYDVAPVQPGKRGDKLLMLTMGYAYVHIPPQAREIDKVIEDHGFRAY